MHTLRLKPPAPLKQSLASCTHGRRGPRCFFPLLYFFSFLFATTTYTVYNTTSSPLTQESWCWRDDDSQVARATCCSCREPRLCSQDPQDNKPPRSTAFLTAIPGHPVQLWYPQAPPCRTHTLANKHSPTI